MKKTILVFTLLLLSVVNFLSAQEKTVYVASEMTRCKGMLEVMCLQLKDSPDEAYDTFITNIQGFTFEEGYEYKLLVNKSRLENAPTDAPQVYSLIKVLSKYLPTDTLEIANRMSICEDTKIFDCLLYRAKGEKEWHNLYGKIKGFKYKKGYDYELLVTKKLNLNMGAGKTYDYALKKILSKKATMVISEKNREDLDGKKYALKGIVKDGSFTSDIGDTKAFITFNLDENRMNGNDGCNTFFGRIDFNNSKIQTGQIASTRMACINDKVWNYFAPALNSADRYTLKGNTLKFYKGKKLLLEFELTNDTDEFNNTKFFLVRINDKGTFKDANDTKAYIGFDVKNNTVFGNDGCNTFTGKAEINGLKISIGNLVSTKIACPDEIFDMVIHNNLSKTNNYKISNGTLKLYDGSNLLLEYHLIMEDVLPEKK